MIDLALGLLLLFFGLASVCSFVHERIASLFGLRQRNLYRALQGLLEKSADPLDENQGLVVRLSRDFIGTIAAMVRSRRSNAVDVLLSTPAIKALRGRGWFGTHLRVAPSYLPREFFVSAAKRVGAMGMSTGMSEEAFKIVNASTDKELGDWFDATMERCAGWYKRQTQVALILIATVIVVVVNVDTLAIGRALMTNAALRQTLALEAQHATAGSAQQLDVDAMKRALDENGRELGLGPRCRLPGGATGAGGAADADGELGLVECVWNGTRAHLAHAPRHLLGWLLSIIAASAGAPFWFDLLSRVASARSTGVPSGQRKKGDDG